MLRKTPLKRGNKPLKRTPLKHKSDKRPKVSKDKQWEFFYEIWNERPHYSEVSGEYLGEEPYSYMFDHAMEKSKYPEHAFNKDNIILCTLLEHSSKTNGFPKPKHKELIEKIKEKLC